MAGTQDSTVGKNERHQLILDLHEIGVVQFGSFILKSGIESPFYFDLRLLFSVPKLLETVATFIWNACPHKKWDFICGVPLTGLPIATSISLKQNIPMIAVRKEAKSHGRKKLIEGALNYENHSCLIIEDVIVSGTSIFETIENLRKEKIRATDVAVFLDRSQGGNKNLNDQGINVSSAVKVTEFFQILHYNRKIDDACYEKCLMFLEQNSSVPMLSESSNLRPKELSFMERSALVTNPLVKRIHNTISNKKSNLCVAVDVSSTSELLRITDLVGPYICILKTHIDILNDFSKECTSKLKELSLKHDFLLFEDRKFCDIGNTVLTQFQGGEKNISSWADIITLHALPGPGVIKGLRSGIGNREIGFLIIAEMSSQGNLCNSDYVKGCLQMAVDYPENVIGFVAQSSLCSNPNQLLFTPGVNLRSSGDNFGQQYISIEDAILNKGTDIIIVGRGIINSDDPEAAAQTYKERGFEALMKRFA